MLYEKPSCSLSAIIVCRFHLALHERNELDADGDPGLPTASLRFAQMTYAGEKEEDDWDRDGEVPSLVVVVRGEGDGEIVPIGEA